MITAVAFDLDDTFFLERDYVQSGFRAIDRYLKEHVDPTRDWLWALWLDFEAGVRGNAFNRVLADAAIEPADTLVADLVRVYRRHQPEIAPCHDVRPAVELLKLPPAQLGVITDGPVEMQRRKFEAMGLADRIKAVIYTDTWGVAFRKPHPRAFVEFETLTGCRGEGCLYVADNPAKDFRVPHERGWTTVRIIRPGGFHAAEPSVAGEVDETLADLRDLAGLLAARAT